MVVVGSRELTGSLSRSMLSLVGLGSVSEHLARHLGSAALLIVKRPPVVASTTAGATHGNDSEMQKPEEEKA